MKFEVVEIAKAVGSGNNGTDSSIHAFNEAIGDGKRVRIKEAEGMWGLGTPEDLNYYLQHYTK